MTTDRLPIQIVTKNVRMSTVEIDGIDIANHVASLTYQHAGGEWPILTVDIPAVRGVKIETEARVCLGPAMLDLLGRLGWTPPAEAIKDDR